MQIRMITVKLTDISWRPWTQVRGFLLLDARFTRAKADASRPHRRAVPSASPRGRRSGGPADAGGGPAEDWRRIARRFGLRLACVKCSVRLHCSASADCELGGPVPGLNGPIRLKSQSATDCHTAGPAGRQEVGRDPDARPADHRFRLPASQAWTLAGRPDSSAQNAA